MQADLAFGITAGARPWLPALARQVEQLGYAELWANESGSASGMRTVAGCRDVTERLSLGVGVVPLSERSPPDIADEALGLGLDRGRPFVLGVGTGRSRSLAFAEAGVLELSERLPGVRIGLAAVGPKMCELAGAAADAAILNWATPERLARQRSRVDAGRARRDRPGPRPRVVAYVRVAVGPGADDRLRQEMERYRRFGPQYARALAEQGDQRVGVAVPSGDPGALRAALEPYRAVVDTVVVRALPGSDDLGGWLAVAHAAAPSAEHRLP